MIEFGQLQKPDILNYRQQVKLREESLDSNATSAQPFQAFPFGNSARRAASAAQFQDLTPCKSAS
ncbi:hypothetical protein L6Q21_14200 [Sandaracinobacter sp. RS1-74]|uniref:hypothetical protein n=1 Tax=Sandaracinobacteroides sayramensis TaxID=2913411 RepID=UPI001EDA7797|nr:hypothetical protein [Sandaracinobacteroides sayramensis]MCG2842136.1 hypothetical protein [Sandaracinobacteroides sayramensis]